MGRNGQRGQWPRLERFAARRPGAGQGCGAAGPTGMLPLFACQHCSRVLPELATLIIRGVACLEEQVHSWRSLILALPHHGAPSS
jgi:hypothetical protein